MTPISVHLYARLGNAMFGYAHARALSEQTGRELRVQPWIGEKIFTLDGASHPRPDGSEEVLRGYFQNQQSLIYTRADCRRWFALKPEIEAATARIQPQMPHVHLRRGDYASAGYPLIGIEAVEAAMEQYGYGDEAYVVVTDDVKNPEICMVSDFVRLMRAPALFRANSTYSWWASVLSHGRVFSPVITGLAGGIEHDNVPYVEGNWPKCADGLDFVTDLHLKEK